MSKSINDIKQDMVGNIVISYPNLVTSEGSPVDDIIINPVAQEISKEYDDLDIIAQNQSILTATSQGIDILLQNIGLIRKSSTTSIGFITFFVSTMPTFDITIPVNTTISTVPSNSTPGVQFLTTQNATMYLSIVSQYFNSITNKYEITTPIESINGGSANNVGPSTITTIITSIAGIDGCYNLNSTLNGSDTESDIQAITRYNTKWSGGGLGVIGGILSTVFASPYVLDALVIGNGNTGREEFGAIDIYVKGLLPLQQTDIYNPIPGTHIPNITFSKQPVTLNGILSVMSSGMGAITASYYTLTKDTGIYAGSGEGVDSLVWNIMLSGDTYGTIFITYVYNNLITELQNIFNNPTQNIVEVSILVKEAVEIPIDLTFTLKIFTGYDIPTVQSDVSTALAVFFSAQKIGQELQQSDIVGAIVVVAGVDDVKIPFTRFQSTDNTITLNTNNNLTIPPTAYAVLGNLIIQ